MPRYLSTRGMPSLAIGICDRCKTKVPYSELRPDGNIPGLKVCRSPSCFDHFDPWRLPARQPEVITLRNPRLDTRIGFTLVFLTNELGDYIGTESGVPIITQDVEGI